MSELSFNSFFNGAQPFGLNVKLPEKTMQQFGKTATNIAGGMIDPVLDYLEQNDNVFSGNIVHETNKLRAASLNIAFAMTNDNEKRNGTSTFDTKF